MMLSERMKANCALCPEADCLADVGTDHGYVPIFLVTSGVVRSAIAMDVNEGPLRRAEEHIREEGLQERITTRLSDGLKKLLPGEADVVLIAGMGGPLTIRILENGKSVLCGGNECPAAGTGFPGRKEGQQAEGRPVRALVLQPQSEVFSVRKYLSVHGWRICREDMVLEDGKFYPMMEAERGQESPDERGLFYGPRLLENKHPVLLQYLKHEEKTLLRVQKSLDQAAGARKEERLKEVAAGLFRNHMAQNMFT